MINLCVHYFFYSLLNLLGLLVCRRLVSTLFADLSHLHEGSVRVEEKFASFLGIPALLKKKARNPQSEERRTGINYGHTTENYYRHKKNEEIQCFSAGSSHLETRKLVDQQGANNFSSHNPLFSSVSLTRVHRTFHFKNCLNFLPNPLVSDYRLFQSNAPSSPVSVNMLTCRLNCQFKNGASDLEAWGSCPRGSSVSER